MYAQYSMPHQLDSTNISYLQTKNSICENILFAHYRKVFNFLGTKFCDIKLTMFELYLEDPNFRNCQMKTNRTPTKTEYLLDDKIYLTYKIKMVHKVSTALSNFDLGIHAWLEECRCEFVKNT